MKPTSIAKYFELGGQLSYLRSAQERNPVHRPNNILDNINRFINNIEESELEVTKNALSELNEFKENLEKTEEEYRINKREVRTLFKIMDRILFVVRAESKAKFIFMISEKRIDVNKLLFNIASLFAKNVFKVLPDDIKYDLYESGKCIAFECSTASAFHVLRGLEGLLRVLLSKLEPQIDTSKMCWGPLITNLENLNIQELSILLDNLDNIRNNYRNPTNHPEKIYNVDEAQDLFQLCVGVINIIIPFMKKHNYI